MDSWNSAGVPTKGFCVVALIVFLALWWDLAQAPWVMDDYFFHHHLARMSFWEALVQRLTGNWNFEFTQAPMYRPGAGLVQIVAHHLAESPAAHRVLSLLLHVWAASMALRLAGTVGLNPFGSGMAFCVLLLQPWAVEALAWPFSFYDPLAEALALWALCCAWPDVPRTKTALLALSLALSCKETMMPMALVVGVVLARRSMVRGLLAAVPLALLLVARSLAIGHPVQSLTEPGGTFAHALAWDLCVVAAATTAGLGLSRLSGRRLGLIGFWAGLAMLPGVHFSVQFAGTPVLLSPRYLYPALFPVVLGLFLLAQVRRPRIAAAIGLAVIAALGILLHGRLAGKRLQAAEAGDVLQAFERLAQLVRPEGPVVILGLSEAAVEPRGAFNGDLPWAIDRPFLQLDLNARSYFAYPRWDAPPTNRFADQGTRQLVEALRAGATVQIFRLEKTELVACGDAGMPSQRSPRLPELDRWGMHDIPVDPMEIRALAIDLKAQVPGPIALSWVSERHPRGWTVPVVRAEEGPELGGHRVWLMLGLQVDWLLAGPVRELRFEGTGANAIGEVRALGLDDPIPETARAAPLYQVPVRRFLVLQQRFAEPLANGPAGP